MGPRSTTLEMWKRPSFVKATKRLASSRGYEVIAGALRFSIIYIGYMEYGHMGTFISSAGYCGSIYLCEPWLLICVLHMVSTPPSRGFTRIWVRFT